MTMIDPIAAPVAPAPPLLQHLDGLVAQLRQHVADALGTGATEAIHQARVATRRLKAANDLLRPMLAEKSRQQWNKLLRRIRRRLGPLRDLDVLSEHVLELSTDRTAAAARWLKGDLDLERAERLVASRQEKVLLRLDRHLAIWQKLRPQIERHLEAVDLLLARSLNEQVEAFALRAMALDAGEGTIDPHAVRIAGKALRYTVEMAVVQGHPLDESIAKSFKKMQDALGLWHDYVVLTEVAMRRSADALLAHHNAPLQHGVITLASESLRRADDRLSKFKELWHEDGQDLVDEIRAAFPLSQAVTEVNAPQTGPDPAGSAEAQASDGPH